MKPLSIHSLKSAPNHSLGSFAFLDFPTDEAADTLDEANAREAETDAEKLGDAEGSGHAFYFEEKVRGPNGVIMHISTKGWDLEPPAYGLALVEGIFLSRIR